MPIRPRDQIIRDQIRQLLDAQSKTVQGVLDTPCRIWTGPIDKSTGYGYVVFKGRKWKTHRLSYKAEHGDPGPLCVLHRCDRPPCREPTHLFLGTRADNARDRDAKNRVRHGYDHADAKLTDEEVAEIRDRYAEGGVKQRELAAEYGVHQVCISKIVLYKNRTR